MPALLATPLVLIGSHAILPFVLGLISMAVKLKLSCGETEA